jgi:thiol-disulfide isomerase/thioredoxin
MFKMHWKSNNWVFQAAFSIAIFANATSALAEFEYFGSSIDYWKEGKQSVEQKSAPSTPSHAPSSKAPNATLGPKEASPSNQFSWPKYMDPNNKEFFREGDYTPPEPFMEIVRNPTDENLKMWFAYIEKKNELTNRLRQRIQEFSGKSAFGLSEEGKQVLEERMPAPQIIPSDTKRYRFRMYFDSHCPHCKRMMSTLIDLQKRGYFVEAKQVDSDPLGMANLPIPSSHATAAEIREKNIQSVPVLLVGDMKSKSVYRLSGYQTVASIFQSISQEVSK